ncbi:MAG: phosphatase PAP2 family protein, partial [Sphaerochaetaceae bacterium]|nr:phosphatase PAP2 family protein [Sphaerochaetaceae bacterium]
MQYFILKFLENIRTPLLDLLANLFSAVTEVEILVPIMVVVYLCINKKLGYIIAISFSLVLTLGNTIKTILKIPRPFMKHEDLSPLRVGTATGYSFPSGHSASASVFYPLLRMVFKNKVIRMLFIILPLLIGLSRNYLGVHWPVDVIVGLSLGYLFSIVLYPLFDNLYE